MRNAFRSLSTIFLFAAACAATVTAQDREASTQPPAAGHDVSSERSVFETLYDDMRIAGEDGLSYVLAPLGFTQRDWLHVGIVAAGTGGLMLADEELRKIPQRNQNQGLYDAANTMNWGGHLTSAEIGTGVLYAAGLISGSDELRVTGRMLAQTLIYAGTTWYVIAILAGRSRPYAEDGAYEFNTGQTDNEFQSLPSGHTNVAFSVATTLATRIDHWAASVLLYSAAAGVGLARIYQDHHWISDVFLGAAIGYTAAKFVAKQEELRREGKQESAAWTVVPTLNGLALQIQL